MTHGRRLSPVQRRVLRALDHLGRDPVLQEHGIRSRCPLHEDLEFRFAVRWTSDTLDTTFTCAGCGADPAQILHALGLTAADIQPPTSRPGADVRREASRRPGHTAGERPLRSGAARAARPPAERYGELIRAALHGGLVHVGELRAAQHRGVCAGTAAWTVWGYRLHLDPAVMLPAMRAAADLQGEPLRATRLTVQRSLAAGGLLRTEGTRPVRYTCPVPNPAAPGTQIRRWDLDATALVDVDLVGAVTR